MALSSQSHCESLPGSFDEYRLSAGSSDQASRLAGGGVKWAVAPRCSSRRGAKYLSECAKSSLSEQTSAGLAANLFTHYLLCCMAF